MINPIYQAFLSTLQWFFGDMMQDAFVAGVLQWVVFIYLLALFVIVFVVPPFYVFRWLYRKLR